MFKPLLTIAFVLSALTASAADAPLERTGTMTRTMGVEIVRTAAAVRATDNVPKVKVPEDSAHENDVSWEMVLAAVALMTAIALRRFRSGPR